MKNFFKKNLLWIIFALTSIILLFIGTIFLPVLIFATFLIGIFLLIFAINSKKKHDRIREEIENKPDESIFDARTLDFDEDIYYLPQNAPTYKHRLRKGFLSKFNFYLPTTMCFLFGIGMIILSVTILFKIIF